MSLKKLILEIPLTEDLADFLAKLQVGAAAGEVMLQFKDSVWARLDDGPPARLDDVPQVKQETEDLINLQITVDHPEEGKTSRAQEGTFEEEVTVEEEESLEQEKEEKDEHPLSSQRFQEFKELLKALTGKRPRSSSRTRETSETDSPQGASQSGVTPTVQEGATAATGSQGGAVAKPQRSMARPYGRVPIEQWRPTPTPADQMESCPLMSCRARISSADRRGHALSAHLPSYFGNDFEEPRLTAFQKVHFRKEFIFQIMNHLGHDTPEKRSNKVCSEILHPTFSTTKMAPLDRTSIKAYCLSEGLNVPSRWVIAEMGTLGLACWQGGMSLLAVLTVEEMGLLLPDLRNLGKKLIEQQRPGGRCKY